MEQLLTALRNLEEKLELEKIKEKAIINIKANELNREKGSAGISPLFIITLLCQGDDDDDDMVEDIVTDDEVAQATMKAKEAIRRKKLAAKQKALKEAAARKKNQASINNRIKEKIQAYYLAEKSLNPAIKDIKANILNSKSLVEAVAKVS